MVAVSVISVLTWGGSASCALGGLLAMLASSKSRSATELSSVRQVDTLSDLKALAPLVPLVVAVTGRVWTARPLSCELSETAAAIVELQEERKGERRAGAVWVRQSEPVRTSVREAEWCLQDASGEPGRQNELTQVPVLAGSSAQGDYLQASGDVFVPAQGAGVMDALVGELAGQRHLGQRIRERALPVGTAITAVGELADVLDHPAAFEHRLRASPGRMLALRPPSRETGPPFVLSRLSLPELVSQLQAESATLSTLGRWLVGVGALSLAVSSLLRLASWRHRRKMRRRIDEARRARQAGARAAAGTTGGTTGGATSEPPAERPAALLDAPCAVCLERDCAMVFPSCGHLCVCEECGTGLRSCPLCRARGHAVRVYMP